ncbi:MAG: ABC transporter ATP-binding protein [Defluviitaleaceae bacterium]|nr:ABC transporter ATP-binding protein [Defluviitaleaceae bacterium]
MDNTLQSNESAVLRLRNLHMNYGKTRALKSVSLDIPRGKIVGILGPNGSGKTTLIKTIMGLLNGYTGEVHIAGHPPGPAANAHISYLPDRNHIPTWFTASQAIALFTDFYKDFDKNQALAMLESMKIPTNKKLRALSRGMQEKVQLSLVMSRRADLYVLDEPIGAVDPASREFIVETILRNFPECGSILLSTHIIADIEPILDVAVFIKEGEIVMQREVEQIREEHGASLDGLFREVFKHVY